MDTKKFDMTLDYVVSDIKSLRNDDDVQFCLSFNNHLAKLLYGEFDGFRRLCDDVLRKLLSSVNDETLWEVIRLICEFRKLRSIQCYCMAEIEAGSQLIFYSVAVYRHGKEVRVPRHLTAEQAMTFKQKYDVSFVIERPYEAQAWLLRWEGRALFMGAVLPDLIEQYG